MRLWCRPTPLGRPPVRQFDVFLSHNHSDSDRVESLARLLMETHGLRVWLDKWECGPGKLEPQCETGIENQPVHGRRRLADSTELQMGCSGRSRSTTSSIPRATGSSRSSSRRSTLPTN